MVSHQYRCVFIHIPKCAGTSIENALGHFDGHEGRGGQDHRSIRMLQQPWLGTSILSTKENTKDTIRRVREQFRSHANPNNGITLNRQQYAEYKKFTIVRNPWMRTYSWYKNAMRDEIHQKNYGYGADMTFSDFMHKYIGQGYLRPQTYWLKDYKGNVPMDFVGKFESLQEDFVKICELLSIKPVELPHKIEGQKSDVSQAFDGKTVDLIKNFYAEEIELFDYKFDT